MTTPRLTLPQLLEDTKSGYVTFNDLGRILGGMLSVSVQAHENPTPPIAPEEGQCWYVPTGATGVWVGHEKQIAQWFNGYWYYYTPQPGSGVFIWGLNSPGYIDGNGDIVILVPPDPYEDVVVADTPTVYYRLDETVGPTVTDRMANVNGTISGTPVLGVTGLVTEGTAYQFAQDGGIDAAFGAGGASYSIECWINLSVLNATQTIVHQSSPEVAVFTSASGNHVNLFWGSTNHWSSISLTSGERYHIVVVVDAGEVSYYVNGSKDANTFSGAPTFVPARLFKDSANAKRIGGVTDEFAFYDFALSEAQITAHYNSGIYV